MAIAIGGGTVQFAIFLLRRKPELRKLDAESDATLLDSANVYIGTLQTGEMRLRDEVAALKTELEVMKRERVAEKLEWVKEREALRHEWDTERAANTVALEEAARESTRVRRLLVQVQLELAGALDEINELKTRVPVGRKQPKPDRSTDP